jgi:hypothetical protein
VYTVGTVGLPAGGEYVRGRGSVVKSWGRIGGEGNDRVESG